MPLHQMMLGAYSFFGFLYVGTCVQMYVYLYECMYVPDPIRLRLRHFHQAEFCNFIVRYPTAGASMYCGHISSFIPNCCYLKPKLRTPRLLNLFLLCSTKTNMKFFSAYKYENASSCWHFHIYQQRKFHVQLCLARQNLQLLVI